MADSNDLSDLVVDKEVDGKIDDKKKKIIIIVVAVLVVVLAVLGVMKYMNIGPLADGTTKSPLPTLDSNNALATPKVDTTVVAEAPKVKEEPIDEPIVDEPIDEPIENVLAKDEPTDEPLVDEPLVDDPIDEPVVDEPTDEDPEISKDIDTVVDDVKKDKKAPKKAPKDDIMTDVDVDAAIEDANMEKGYYIQISANQRVKPSAKYIASYEEKGYTVHKLEISIDGIATTKVLVGPYTDKGEAKTVLEEIRIERDDAFIYNVR